MKGLIPLTVSILGLFFLPMFVPDETASKESGTVVSKLNRTLVVIGKDEKNTRQIEIPSGTPIFLDSKPAKFEEIQPGDMVDVAYNAEKKVIRVDGKSGATKEPVSSTGPAKENVGQAVLATDTTS